MPSNSGYSAEPYGTAGPTGGRTPVEHTGGHPSGGRTPVERVPVLVVGAGYAGLSAAALLAWRGVPVLLAERHAGTSVQPKAFGVNQRAMELLRPVPGLERALVEIAEGVGDGGMRIAIASSLSDPEPQMIFNTHEGDYDFLAGVTPVPTVGAPQAQVERALRAAAEELGADLRFSTELVSLEQDADGVTALLRDLATGVETRVRADYLVAADGHRSPVRELLGIPVTGRGELGRLYSIMFDADLTGLAPDREVTLWYLRNETFSGVIVTGTGVGSHVLGVNYDPAAGQSEADFTDERCVELVRRATGLPGLEVKLLDRTAFAMAHVLAGRYRQGRVFLAGDAAHTMPPTGGQGGSTALQDGCDLAWRLWLVISGQAGEGLLDTYDAERRPIGALTADAQLANLAVRMPPAARAAYPEPLADPFAAILGYRYHSAAVVAEADDDGSLLEDPREPTGRPGSRAPHVALEREGGPISTHDLFGSGFVLLTGADGGEWARAAAAVADRLGVRLTPYRIGGDLTDPAGVWERRYGVRADGAVLVRPDGYVAWRSREAAGDPEGALEGVLTRVLARPAH
ncbi:FAD-dependent oxidoreductase [Planobispora rosea]|uniref:FAD-dependent oxidoreductase n=1 Tax=Planobispora rosea TaxID=35762 RepID=A0A8J3S4U9_PLARO|nr:FAD-dependent monooxygenase [Planobispora rosea]GGS66593.1 FAD-dependent oxidoreductase [Planobispora rosea]GIH85044.1 FAD-dependent oxidoreductase [Planobispora rosea]